MCFPNPTSPPVSQHRRALDDPLSSMIYLFSKVLIFHSKLYQIVRGFNIPKMVSNLWLRPVLNNGSFLFFFDVQYFWESGLVWANYNDLTATSLESWLIREIIPKLP